ncbi:small multidrug resistance pump [Brevibacterium sanguinis]|uniref:Small multidrug resistance pump n=2 Tax=Brevibacterium TaxID=1696 RepID=A0A366IEZ5_9MICO|nr:MULTISPECIES: multidrug efflux SMR transporter [Brevibacterium]RBP62421.1 small multidrug resistance pump [Brevibacterium sanguinis]RBP68810.1 small multidrug resistance pump [Brevibacterium celere]
MLAWGLLGAAILLEVAATICLRIAAVGGSRWWYAAVGIGYVVSFGLLSLTLRTGFPLGVAYGIWAATGVALTALAGRVLFGERLTRTMTAGIALIIVGVLLVELGSHA